MAKPCGNPLLTAIFHPLHYYNLLIATAFTFQSYCHILVSFSITFNFIMLLSLQTYPFHPHWFLCIPPNKLCQMDTRYHPLSYQLLPIYIQHLLQMLHPQQKIMPQKMIFSSQKLLDHQGGSRWKTYQHQLLIKRC
jgi:hypothetical protein